MRPIRRTQKRVWLTMRRAGVLGTQPPPSTATAPTGEDLQVYCALEYVPDHMPLTRAFTVTIRQMRNRPSEKTIIDWRGGRPIADLGLFYEGQLKETPLKPVVFLPVDYCSLILSERQIGYISFDNKTIYSFGISDELTFTISHSLY
jgi:hypothetical protein